MPNTPAAEQFTALGIPASDYTKAMLLAVKQRWSNLPVDEKVGDLRDARDAVVLANPSSIDVEADVRGRVPAVAEADVAALVASELVRLRRNAAVNAWRERNKLQAAIDARDLKFAALRAKRGNAGAPKPGTVTGDAAPLAAAS